MWLGIVLLVLGLLGHLLAAQGIGGTAMAYQHHIFAFFFLTLVSGVFIAGLGRRFWKGRNDITVLILGVTQALLGLAVTLHAGG